MGTMMKELLVIITIAMVCGGLHIPQEVVNDYQDEVLRECFITRNGHSRPHVHPSRCSNEFSDNVCAFLYPVTSGELQEDRDDDYYVSSRCYEGLIQNDALNCASKCAICCETPKFNCSNLNTFEQCDVISQLELCEHPDMKDFVSRFCRQACGLCEQPEFSEDRLCADERPQYCSLLFGSVPCTVPYMQKNCKGTCFVLDDADCQSGYPVRPRPGHDILLSGLSPDSASAQPPPRHIGDSDSQSSEETVSPELPGESLAEPEPLPNDGRIIGLLDFPTIGPNAGPDEDGPSSDESLAE